jgi:hypothetical protein
VGPAAPVLIYTGQTTGAPAAVITLSATLMTGSGTPIAGKTVTFTLNGVTLNATTNSFGIASIKTKAPAIAGSYPIGVAFAGDATYAAASASATLAVRTATKLTYKGATKAAPGGVTITLSATLKTASMAMAMAIAGEIVTFTLNGVTLSATTNSSGVASVVTTAPATAGIYTIEVTFAGDATYSGASDSATLRVR